MKIFRSFTAILLVCLWATPVSAQGAQVAFGGLQQDISLPIEMAADELTINQENGTAVFKGNVVIGQGDMRLSAALVTVEYANSQGDATGQISRLLASGGVTLVNGAEAAEAETAEYSVETGRIVMKGNVLMTQGANALSSEQLEVDLNTGTGVMTGRVRTILQSGGN